MKVLLISFFYPPLNSIASNRIYAFKKYLDARGIECAVITRFYDEDQRRGHSVHVYENPPQGFVHEHIREGDVVYTNYSIHSGPKRVFDRLPPGIKGAYGYLYTDVYSYGWKDQVLKAYEQEFREEKFDLVIASLGPPIVFRIAKELKDRYGIPYLIDYRDIFITEEDKGLHLLCKKMVQDHYLRHSRGLIVVSDGMRDYFWKHAGSVLKDLPVHLVMNGIDGDTPGEPAPGDEEQVRTIEALRKQYDHVLLHTGTLYPRQDILQFRQLVEGYNLETGKKAVLVLVGPGELVVPGELENDFCIILPKVSQRTSLYLQKSVDALVFPAWPDRYSGFAGKLFEYLASGTKVLIGERVQHDVKDFVQEYANVHMVGNAEQFHRAIESLPARDCPGSRDKLQRKYWVDRFADALESRSK